MLFFGNLPNAELPYEFVQTLGQKDTNLPVNVSFALRYRG